MKNKNKNSIAYGLLAGAGVNTDKMEPKEAWDLVEEMGLLKQSIKPETSVYENITTKELSKKLKIDLDYKKESYQHIEKVGREYNLTNKEIHALHKYVNSFKDDWYVNINKCLRDGTPLSEEDKKICQNLNSALDKIPKYKGRLQRVLSLKGNALKKFLEEHTVGQIVTYPSFTSTSASEKDQVKGNVKIYIDDAQNGADIREFNTLQLEVLYKTNASFFVLAEYKFKNRYYILLKENLNEEQFTI